MHASIVKKSDITAADLNGQSPKACITGIAAATSTANAGAGSANSA
jgi:hypothetical protein